MIKQRCKHDEYFLACRKCLDETKALSKSASATGLYGLAPSDEYVIYMERHRNILADALAEIMAACDNDNLDRIKEVIAGCIEEIKAI